MPGSAGYGSSSTFIAPRRPAASIASTARAQREAAFDERNRVDVAALEQFERRVEWSAPRADHSELVDHERREVQRHLAAVGRLEHQGAAWPQRTARELEPRGRTGRLHHHVPAPRLDVVRCDGLDAARAQERSLVLVARDDSEVRAGEREYAGDELTQTACTDEQDAVLGADRNLLEDLDSRSERFDEDGGFVRHGVWDPVQVRDRERRVLGVHPVSSDDSEHGAPLAVGRSAAPTRLALAARSVDVAYYARADPARFGGSHDLADELVAEHAGERVVAAYELEVGPADAREPHADERLVGRVRQRYVADRKPAVLEPECSHGSGYIGVAHARLPSCITWDSDL